MIGWSADDQVAAARQGWNIFYPDSSEHATFEIQKIDGSEEDTTKEDAGIILDRFKTDNDAWVFVWKGATEHGDPVAQRALAFLYYRSPEEYRAVRKFCTGMELPPPATLL